MIFYPVFSFFACSWFYCVVVAFVVCKVQIPSWRLDICAFVMLGENRNRRNICTRKNFVCLCSGVFVQQGQCHMRNYVYYYQKLLEIEKEVVREVALGGLTPPEKICRSQSTNQSGECLSDLCFVICRFSQGVFIPRAQPHAQSFFLFPIF